MKSQLCGWDFDAWRAVVEWARADVDICKATMQAVVGSGNDEEFRKLLDAREKWEKAGGPASGPGEFILEVT